MLENDYLDDCYADQNNYDDDDDDNNYRHVKYDY